MSRAVSRVVGRRQGERGAATLLVVTCAGVLLLVGTALGAVSALVVAHRSAQSAADLSALAAAAAAASGQDACSAGSDIATRNGATVTSCETEGFTVTVSVTVPGPSYAGHHTVLRADARAGPSP